MKRIDTINVIPFIDIMLVLLAIVLTTATFVAQGVIPVDLPRATDPDTVMPSTALQIVVTRDGRLFAEGEALSAENLGRILDGLPDTGRVVVSVDREAAFESFFQVVDLLRVRDIENFSIVATTDHR
jgi:biopolymer transport protein ExbD